MDELLNEARTMAQLKHGNLLRFHGVTFYGEKQKLSLVTDFMENGSLLNYLKNQSNNFLQLNSKTSKFILNSFSKQIFQAMIYLEKRDIVHRDLAARNCLIGENNILKVGDFGLTRFHFIFLFSSLQKKKLTKRKESIINVSFFFFLNFHLKINRMWFISWNISIHLCTTLDIT